MSRVLTKVVATKGKRFVGLSGRSDIYVRSGASKKPGSVSRIDTRRSRFSTTERIVIAASTRDTFDAKTSRAKLITSRECNYH